MKRLRRTRRGGFSLLEVVIVVAIIAILAAIGIPRMSRGSKGAGDSALSGDLAVLRNAIDLYAAEHGGSLPTNDIANELTQYTTALGVVSSVKTTTAIYGPYIRSIPPVPVGDNKGKTGIGSVPSDPNAGWVYDSGTGTIYANTGALADDTGTAYTDY